MIAKENTSKLRIFGKSQQLPNKLEHINGLKPEKAPNLQLLCNMSSSSEDEFKPSKQVQNQKNMNLDILKD